MSETQYTAWRRRAGSPWQPIGTAPTEAEAWQLAFKAMDRTSSGAFDTVVLPSDEQPRDKRRKAG